MDYNELASAAVILGESPVAGDAAELWLVLQWIATAPEGGVFEVFGIFSSRALAVAACRDWTYCVNGPIVLDAQAPHDSCAFAESFYPVNEAAASEAGS